MILRRAILVLSLCAAAPICAGEGLTWERAAQEAGRGNADIRAAEEGVARARAQVGVSFSPFLPTVVGAASYSHGNASSASGSVPGGSSSSSTGTAFGVITTTNQYSLGLTATQNVFNGFQDRSALVQARSNLTAAEAGLRAAKATAHQNLKKAFYQLMGSQLAVTQAQEVEKRRKKNFQLVELRFQGGRENKGALLRSRAQWRSAQFNVRQNQRNVFLAQQQLAFLLGRRDFEGISVVGSLKTKPLPAGIGDTRELAKTTPGVEQQAAIVKAAEASREAALGSLLPSVSVSGSISKVGLSFPPETDRWSVGVNITVPVFKYSSFSAISSARADERKADAALDSIDRQAAVTLSTALTGLQLAVENVDVQTDVRDAAFLRAEIARGQYASGLINFMDWDLIETDLIAQDQSLLSVKQAAVNAEADWEQAMGRGDIP